MDLDGGKSISPGISRLFWAQMALATLIPISGPKKSGFQGPPLQTPLVIDYSPIQIHTSAHINNRYINIYKE